MAELTELDRQRIWRGLMRYWSNMREETSVSKADLRAAIDATDAWIDDNQVSFNTALPEPFKGEASQAQKTLMFCIVATMRVDPGFVRRILGEVD